MVENCFAEQISLFWDTKRTFIKKSTKKFQRVNYDLLFYILIIKIKAHLGVQKQKKIVPKIIKICFAELISLVWDTRL